VTSTAPVTLEPRIILRLTTEAAIDALHALIEASVRSLPANDYTPAQIEGALGTVLGVDTQLIADRTYFAAESVDRKWRFRDFTKLWAMRLATDCSMEVRRQSQQMGGATTIDLASRTEFW
jgi:hypothetical protein